MKPLEKNSARRKKMQIGNEIFQRQNFVILLYLKKYLIRTNFRADKFSRTSSARKLEIFARIYFRAPFTKIRNSVLIFAQFRANCWLKELFCKAFFKIWSLKIFARINFRAPATNLQKFGTNFRAISRKSRFCAKMRENLSARKLVRIR